MYHMEVHGDVDRYELHNKQYKMFLSYKPLFEKIYKFNSEERPINVTVLSSELGKHKQQISKVINILESLEMIEKMYVPKWQQKGGRSHFLFLTPHTKQLIKQSREYLREEFQTVIDTNDVDRYIDRFENNDNDTVREKSLDKVYRLLIDLCNHEDNINWKRMKKFNLFMEQMVKDYDDYSKRIQDQFLKILEFISAWGYVNSNIYPELLKIFRNGFNEPDRANVVNGIFTLFTRTISTMPVKNSVHYRVFLDLYKELENYDEKILDMQTCITWIYKFPPDIKEDLETYLFSLLTSVDKDNENYRYNIDKMIDNLS